MAGARIGPYEEFQGNLMLFEVNSLMDKGTGEDRQKGTERKGFSALCLCTFVTLPLSSIVPLSLCNFVPAAWCRSQTQFFA